MQSYRERVAEGCSQGRPKPMQLHWAPLLGIGVAKQINVIRRKSNILAPQNFWAGYATGSGGSAPWCLGRLFTFARYTLRLRIQYKRHINFIVNRERSRQN